MAHDRRGREVIPVRRDGTSEIGRSWALWAELRRLGLARPRKTPESDRPYNAAPAECAGSLVSIVVLKFGGEIVANADALAGTFRDVRALVERGDSVVIVHGGGPQTLRLSQALSLLERKVAGQRVTDGPTLQVVKQALGGEVAIDVVAAAIVSGVRAVGLSGVSAGLLSASRRPVAPVPGSGDAPVDYGFVGDIGEVRTELLHHLWAGGYVPVLNPLGVATAGEEVGQVFNINGDTAAAAVAGALQADHLVLVTAVGGVRRDRDDPATTLARLTPSQAQAAIADGTIAGGMIPKVDEALKHLSRGIKAVHIVGPGPDRIAQAVEQPGRHGTVLVPEATD